MKSRAIKMVTRGKINTRKLTFSVLLCVVSILIGFFYPVGHEDVESHFSGSELYSIPPGIGSFYFYHHEKAIVTFNFILPDPEQGNCVGVEIPVKNLKIGKNYEIVLEIKDGYDRDWPGQMEMRLLYGDTILWNSDVGLESFSGWIPVTRAFIVRNNKEKIRVELYVKGNPSKGAYWGHQGPFGFRNIAIIDRETRRNVESFRLSLFNFSRFRIIFICVFLCGVFIVLMTNFSNNRIKIFIRTFAYLIYLIVVTCILGEILSRIFDPMGVEYFPSARRYFQSMIYNQSYAYINKPGYRDRLQGVDVIINRHGLRSPEFSIRKIKGIHRLLILGDSVVFGWGVAQDKILSARLMEMLNQRDMTWEVINAGVGSWNTRNEYEFVRNRGRLMDIDVIVLIVTANDIDPKLNGNTYISKDILFKTEIRNLSNRITYSPGKRQLFRKVYQSMIKNSYLFSNIYWLVKTRKAVVQKLQRLYKNDSPAWLDAKHALESLISFCNKDNIQLMIYFYYQDRVYDPYFLLYENVVKNQGLRLYSFPPNLYGRKFWNSPVDSHPNAEGHRLMADQIFRDLKPQ